MPWHAESVDQAGTGHALLALLLSKDELLLAELERRGIEAKVVLEALGRHFPRRSRAREEAETGAKLIVEAVAAGRIQREQLIRAVLTDYWGVAGQVFRDLTARRDAAGEVRPVPLVQLDDGSERTIYEQIVAQIQEGIATGRLQPGDRLPTVRELADQLAIAPGTVARAYSELERQNTVVTHGPRGTRVAGRPSPGTAPPASPGQLAALLRPAVVAAFHMGATAAELRSALDDSMRDIYPAD